MDPCTQTLNFTLQTPKLEPTLLESLQNPSKALRLYNSCGFLCVAKALNHKEREPLNQNNHDYD